MKTERASDKPRSPSSVLLRFRFLTCYACARDVHDDVDRTARDDVDRTARAGVARAGASGRDNDYSYAHVPSVDYGFVQDWLPWPNSRQ